MTPIRAAAGLLVGLLLAGPAPAAELVSDISEHSIAITSSFQGTDLLVFGAVSANAAAPELKTGADDVVVVVRGPATPVIVRRKARVAGIWMNRAEMRFDAVPGYYAVAASTPLADIAAPAVLRRHRIGLDHLNLPIAERAAERDAAPFRRAVVRRRQENDLFHEVPGGVRFLGGTLFRADLRFPASVPVGDYRVEVYLFRDGKVVHRQSAPLSIDKSGIERQLFVLAREAPVFYGLGAVAVAVAAGWIGAALFRRG